MIRRIVAAAVLLVGCRGEEESAERIVVPDDGVSYLAPAGYTARRDRDTWVLSRQGERARTTIAIRTVKNADWSTDGSQGRPPDVVIPATELALKALPGAEVSRTRSREHAEYRASELSVVFTPRSRGGERYERTHVTLFAPEHVIHVFQTAPAGRAAITAGDFARVVDSIREDG